MVTVVHQSRRSTAAHYSTLLRTLTFSEFKLRYAHSSLGYVWTVSKPLLLFGVMYVVFSQILRFGEGIAHYPVILLMGNMLFGFFGEATSGAVSVLVSRADMLRKAAFPRSILPVSVVTTSLMVFAFNLVALAVFAVWSGVQPRLEMIWLVPIVLELTALAIGMSLLLSGLYVYMRDIGQLWAVLLQVLFYASPIIYPIEFLQQNHVPQVWESVMLSNPTAQIVNDARWALVGSGARSTADILGALYVVPLGIVAGLFISGLLVYRVYANRLAEHV
jgi:ABC-2 type transport system permease protein